MAVDTDARTLTRSLAWLEGPPFASAPPNVEFIDFDHVEAADLKITYGSVQGILTIWWNSHISELSAEFAPGHRGTRQLSLVDFLADAREQKLAFADSFAKNKSDIAALGDALISLLKCYKGVLAGEDDELRRVIAAGDRANIEYNRQFRPG
jgi:hypothetical protein